MTPPAVPPLLRSQRPLVWLTVGLLCGQGLGALPHAPLIGLGAALVALLCLTVRLDGRVCFSATAVAIALGAVQMDSVLRPRLGSDHIEHQAGTVVELSARVAERASRQPLRTRLLFDVDAIRAGTAWRPAHGRVLVTVRDAVHPWQRGDRVRAQLFLRRPRNFGNPGEFDYEAFLARRGVHLTAFAQSDAAWERQPAQGEHITALFDTWRNEVERVINQTLTGATREIAAALLIGDVAISPEVRDRYTRTGVSHVLSISGLHVSLVLSAAYGAGRWLLARSEWLLLRGNVPKLALGLTSLPILLYAGIAGFSVPTIRAITMVLMWCVATLLDRHRDWLTSLACAASAICLLWPGSLFEISFQLSFVSVFAIVVGMRRLTAWWTRWEEARLIRLRSPSWRYVRWGVLYVGVTICATVATAPLTAYHFNQISLISLVANPLVVPLLGIVPVGAGLIAAVAVPFAPGIAAMLLTIVGMVITFADSIIALLALVPGAAIRTITPSELELLLLYALLGGVLLTRRRYAALVLAGIPLLGDAAWWYVERRHSGALRITFLSVGQGDCTIVEFPGSAVMVIDGGGLVSSFDVGERLIGPYLWRRKITQIDTIVLTHPQFDHYGGLGFLARTFGPRALWWNGSRGRGRSFDAFWRAVEPAGVPTLRVTRDFEATIDGVHVVALAPSDHDPGSLNDRSVTLHLRYGSMSVLLPGDLEANGEWRLVATAGSRARSTILKVPHHGSRTSSTAAFLDAVDPQLAVISAGDANRYGMPHADVLTRYAARGIPVLRTDRDGAVIVEVGGDGSISVRTGRARAIPRYALGRGDPAFRPDRGDPAFRPESQSANRKAQN